MPLTVITLKKVPRSLRGDLTKWMQEIATGVYVGNFNSKVREELWNRVKDNVKDGEATISYAFRNEIGYNFDIMNSQREVINYDGIPLIILPEIKQNNEEKTNNNGYSTASKLRSIKRFSHKKILKKKNCYVVVDIETDGLDEDKNTIIEFGALKVENNKLTEFNCLVKYDRILPKNITELTGLNAEALNNKGVELEVALNDFVKFIGSSDIVGYGIEFDVKFLNRKLVQFGMPVIRNKRYDLIKYVKKEQPFLANYKLQTALKSYGIKEKLPHRALEDTRLILKLSTKVNKFIKIINEK